MEGAVTGAPSLYLLIRAWVYLDMGIEGLGTSTGRTVGGGVVIVVKELSIKCKLGGDVRDLNPQPSPPQGDALPLS